MEVWRDIPGYEGVYMVSSYGRVRRICPSKREGNGIRVTRLTTNGYVKVNLSKDGVAYHVTVHRLVAQAFIPNPNNLPQVNHKDEDKTNNHVENLEWCDARYNNNYGTKKARFRATRLNDPRVSKPVLQFTMDGKLVAEYPSAREAGRATGFLHGNIKNCCRGKVASAYKFKWAFK
jgi:hypothetical protein